MSGAHSARVIWSVCPRTELTPGQLLAGAKGKERFGEPKKR